MDPKRKKRVRRRTAQVRDCDFVEIEAGKYAPRFEHPVRLVQDIWDRGDVPDPKRDGVQNVGVVGERVRGQFLRVSFNKSNLLRCKVHRPSGTENK